MPSPQPTSVKPSTRRPRRSEAFLPTFLPCRVGAWQSYVRAGGSGRRDIRLGKCPSGFVELYLISEVRGGANRESLTYYGRLSASPLVSLMFSYPCMCGLTRGGGTVVCTGEGGRYRLWNGRLSVKIASYSRRRLELGRYKETVFYFRFLDVLYI